MNDIRNRIHLPLKKNEQDLLWNFGSYAVMGICGVLKYFVIAAFYSPEVLGVYNQVYSIYMMVSQFSTGGVHLSTLKYVAQYAHDPKKYRIIGTSALLLAWFFALVTCVTLWLMRGTIGVWLDSANVAVGLLYAIPGLLFFSLNKVFLAVMNGLSKMKTYAIYQALRYILMVVVIVIVAVLGLPGPALSVVFTITEIILSIFLVVTLRSEISLPSVEEWKEWLRTHFSFGIRSMFSNVLVGLNPRVNVLILGYFSSDFVVGVFSLASAAAEGLYQLPIIVRTVFNPILVRLIDSGKLDDLKIAARKVIRYTYLGMFVAGVGVVSVYPFALFFVANRDKFLLSWPIFGILVAGLMINAGYVPFSNILLLGGRPGYQTWMILIQVLTNILLNLILVPLWGGIGAAVATAVSYISLVVLVRSFSRKILNIRI